MKRSLRTIRSARAAALTVAGLGCVDVAVWLLHPIAGLATTGVSLLLLEALTRPDQGGTSS